MSDSGTDTASSALCMRVALDSSRGMPEDLAVVAHPWQPAGWDSGFGFHDKASGIVSKMCLIAHIALSVLGFPVFRILSTGVPAARRTCMKRGLKLHTHTQTLSKPDCCGASLASKP